MKNTALVLTTSTIATIFILVGIFSAYPEMHIDLVTIFWKDFGELNDLGSISVGIIIATAVYALLIAYRKRQRIVSYVLGATAGVLLGIFLDMIIYLDAMFYWMP